MLQLGQLLEQAISFDLIQLIVGQQQGGRINRQFLRYGSELLVRTIDGCSVANTWIWTLSRQDTLASSLRQELLVALTFELVVPAQSKRA